MTTAYPLDATTALPRVRRPSTSFEPRIAESSQSIKTRAKIFVLSTSAVVLVAALLMIQIDNPPTNERGCILSANLHNSLVRPGGPPLAVERDWHNHGLSILREPADTGCTANR
jgi:hypothetical protein